MPISIIIPAHNEELNVGPCLVDLRAVLASHAEISYEILVINDCSTDRTADVVQRIIQEDASVRLINRGPPHGFGRAIRNGLAEASGDVVVIYMADRSDDPNDVIAYYRKIEEGYDCVYGSRFVSGSHVEKYPPVKLIVNRIVNRGLQLLFWTGFNDLTNAFKAYRAEVVRDCGPFCASHFNITVEMSLSAVIRRYRIAQIPINWYGRTWGSTNLRLIDMGRRYLSTVLMLLFQKILVADDLIAERTSNPLNTETRNTGRIGEAGKPLTREMAADVERPR